MIYGRFILAFGLALATACCFAQQTVAARADLRDEATVDHRVVTLGDIAKLSGVDAQDLDTLQHVQLVNAPQTGYSLHLTRREVQRLLNEAGYAQIILDGAPAISVTISGDIIDVKPIIEMAKDSLLAALHRDGITFTLTPDENLPEIRVPHGRVTYQARTPKADRLRSRMSAWVDLLLDGSVYRTVQVSFHVSAEQNVFVTQTNLVKGQKLECANLQTEARDIAPLRALPQSTNCAILPQRLRRNLSAGEVILADELEPIPAVSEGDVITLEVSNGAVSLESRAVALADGQIGQRIPVRATSSQESVLALVTAPGVVNLSGR